MADASEEELLRELLEYRDERVIVEGVKDERALKSLGFSDVTRLNGGCSILSVVESLQGSRVSVLTDLDQEGKILRKKLLELFNMYGMQEIKRPREILAQLRISHVEGLQNLGKGD
jgi:5S rRNA maturation endonuclease (ribonuclease M5)